MYRLLIVDDEPVIVNGLVQLISGAYTIGTGCMQSLFRQGSAGDCHESEAGHPGQRYTNAP